MGDHVATRNQNLRLPCPFILSLPKPHVSMSSSKSHFTDTNLMKTSLLLASLFTRISGALYQELRAETDIYFFYYLTPCLSSDWQKLKSLMMPSVSQVCGLDETHTLPIGVCFLVAPWWDQTLHTKFGSEVKTDEVTHSKRVGRDWWLT